MNNHLTPAQRENLEFWIESFNAQLLEKSVQQGGLRYWETYAIAADNRNKTTDELDLTIYNGNAGLALYLLTYYRYSSDPKYLQYAIEATDWIVANEKKSKADFFDLYTGKSGIIYLLSELYDHTQNIKYLDAAVGLVKQNQSKFIDHFSDDLLSGIAGNLLVLTQVAMQTNDKEIIKLIGTCLNELINNAYLSHHGIKWRYRPNYIDSLCGLSHGAAGIGFALLEIGYLLDDAGLIWLGEQSFAYEDQYYMPEQLCWPDLRIHPEKLANPDKVHEKDILLKGEQVDGWAHGSVGIAMTRLRAFEHSKKEENIRIAIAIADHICAAESTKTYNFIINNGLGANAYFLAKIGDHLVSSQYLEAAYDIISQAQEVKKQLGYLPSGWNAQNEHLSIFMGETGIAFSMLQLLNASSDIVLPTFRQGKSTVKIPLLSKEQIVQQLFSKYFKESSRFVSKLPSVDQITNVSRYFLELDSSVIFLDYEKHQNDILELEQKKLALEMKAPNFQFLSDRYRSITNSIDQSFDETTVFKMNDFTAFSDVGEEKYLLVKYRYGVESISLTPFVALLLATLDSPKSVNAITELIQSQISATLETSKITALIMDQVKELLERGVVRILK